MTINTIKGALIVFKARLRELEELREKIDNTAHGSDAGSYYSGMVDAYKESIAMMEK